MLRFVIKSKHRDKWSQASWESTTTVLADVPELEAELRAGGMDVDSYEIHELVGVEVTDDY